MSKTQGHAADLRLAATTGWALRERRRSRRRSRTVPRCRFSLWVSARSRRGVQTDVTEVLVWSDDDLDDHDHDHDLDDDLDDDDLE